MRKESGLSQKDLARLVGTSRQQISRPESTRYEGHSLSMIRRVAEALGATVQLEIHKAKRPIRSALNESKAEYKTKKHIQRIRLTQLSIWLFPFTFFQRLYPSLLRNIFKDKR